MYNFECRNPYFLPHSGCDISFNLHEGGALVIVGQNGIGKTTLLQQIAQYFASVPLAYVEQKPLEFFFDYTLSQLREIRPGIDQYWDRFGLQEKSQRQLSILSGGEAQALKLSCALASSKNLIVMDEPSQALDTNKKKILSELISEFLLLKKSFLIVEHDLEWLPKNIPVLKLGEVSGVIKVVDQWTT